MPQWMPTPAITPDSVVLPRTKDPASPGFFVSAVCVLLTVLFIGLVVPVLAPVS
jgi:hypothetical protein